jgi:RNA polymerase sigma factor (sigma-70 family)
MGIRAKKAVHGTNKASFCQRDWNPATASLLRYYTALDLGATRFVMNHAAQDVYDHLHSVVEAAAKRLVPRRTGLRGKASVHAVEEITQGVLANLLSKVKPGSSSRRFDPSKRDLGAFVWVLVDRAVISGICRRRIPACFTTLDLKDGLLACHRVGNPGDQLEILEQAAELRQALDLLPGSTGQVMQGVYLRGEGKKKVAQAMGRSPSFVTREIAKGIMMLQAIYRHVQKFGAWPDAFSSQTRSSDLDA